MSRLRFAPLSLACVGLFLIGAAPPQDKPDAADEPAKPKPATVKVETGPLKVSLELKGVFQAEATHELAIRPDAWTQPLVVAKAVPHGTTIKKGDVVVEFERDKIDRAIEDQAIDQTLAALAIELAEEELPILEKFLPIDLAAAERAKRHAEEDLQTFLSVDRPLSEESARFQVKGAEERLKYSAEELKQLKAMYRDKDLTEETEEMILQRQRFEVESAEFSLKQSKIRTEQTLEVQLPRQEQTLRDAALKSALDHEKARGTLPLNVNQKRLALKKQKEEFARSAEKLDDLRADREAMTVRAPADGVVYYGKSTDGEWSGIASAAQKLTTGGQVQPSEVFLTIVEPRPVSILAKVKEEDLHKLSTGMTGTATPAGYPDAKLPAVVDSILPIPAAGGDFRATLEVTLTDDATPIMPGMTCTIDLSRTLADSALTLPASAVFGEREERFVYRPKDEGDPEKVAVKVGRKVGNRLEIKEGLSEGDEVLADRP